MKDEILVSHESENNNNEKNYPQSDDASASVSIANKNMIDDMKNAFMKINKDIDSSITKEEIVYFLDKHSPSGTFNKKVCDKILINLFPENQETILVQDCIAGFSGIITEMKQVIKESENRLKKEIDRKDLLIQKCDENKEEKMINDVAENAKFTISFKEVEFMTVENFENKNFFIKLSLEGRETHTTDSFNSEKQCINQSFEFSPKSKQEKLTIELFTYGENADASNSELFGEMELPLDKFEQQEEFDVKLEIPDLNDQEKTNLVIDSKAIFIYSYYEYYANLLNNSGLLIDKIKEKSQKAKEILDCFLSLKFMKSNEAPTFTQKNQNEPTTRANINSESNMNPNSNMKSTRGGSTITGNNTYSFADTVDNMLSQKFHTQNINWLNILFITSIISLISIFISNFTKSDMINIFAIILIIYRIYTIKNSEMKETFSFISILILVSFGYDLIWFITCNKSCNDTKIGDCFFQNVAFYLSILNCVIKGVMLGEAYMLKEKMPN